MNPETIVAYLRAGRELTAPNGATYRLDIFRKRGEDFDRPCILRTPPSDADGSRIVTTYDGNLFADAEHAALWAISDGRYGKIGEPCFRRPVVDGEWSLTPDEPGYYGTDNDSEIGPEVYPAKPLPCGLTEIAALTEAIETETASLATELQELKAAVEAEKADTVRYLAYLALATLLSLPALAAPQPCTINVNAATQAELELFARTGPALALRLASGRPYKALEAVDKVKGVGPSWMAVNGPHVALQGPTTCTEKVPSPRAPKVAAQAPKL